MGKEAYVNRDGRKITIGTGLIEKTVRLTEDGKFSVSSFRNLKTGKEFISSSPIAQDEFYLTVDGKYVSGSTEKWELTDLQEKRGTQNELEAVITLDNGSLKVIRHYIAYPGQPVIQEYTEYVNETDAAIKVSHPSILVMRSVVKTLADEDFSYMTGGANFTGSQMFKTVALTPEFTKHFDSQRNPEVIEVEGEKKDVSHERFNGCGMWNEFFVLTDRKAGQGIFITFDYQGCWKGDITCTDNNPFLTAYCDINDYEVGSREVLTIARAAFGLYEGDTDSLGNTIMDYIYTYKWDYTRDQYFDRTNLCIWKAAPLNDRVFRMVQYATYVGYERVWVDDFWFDAKGNYEPVWGDDWTEANRYMNAHGMKFRLWMPPWHADRLSRVSVEHPDWMLDFHGNWYNWTIDMSREEAYQWVLNMMTEKQKEFGTYDLRVDGDPCNLADNEAFDQKTQNGNWNVTLKQSENFYRLYKEFKDRNPEAGIDGCSSGGHTLTIESARYCDQHQITDGECLHYGGYWTSMILPIDKHQGFPLAGTSRPDAWQNPEHAYMDLFTAPCDGMQHPEIDASPEVLEIKRRQLEKFYYLRRQGVYGRYIKVFRPEVEHADRTYILQRMNGDCTKGLIMISANDNNPMLGKSERIFIKGLDPEKKYFIDSELGSVVPEEKTGAEWMKEGVYLSDVERGEYVYINLKDRPGKLTPGAAPAAPANAAKSEQEFMKHRGIAVTWDKAGGEEISYYRILRNGKECSKVAIGTLFFDTEGSLSDTYAVSAVDYSGAESAAVEI